MKVSVLPHVRKLCSLATLSPRVAALLGGGWSSAIRDENFPKPELAHESGAGIWLHRDSRTNRITVTGYWPRVGTTAMSFAPSPAPHITVAGDVTAERLAREIERRFLVEYLPEFEKQKARAEATTEHENRTRTNLERLAGQFGLSIRGSEQAHYYSRSGEPSRYGDIRVNGDSVRIDVGGLTVEQAEAILRVVTG
jgi:hypothetical protein